MTEVRNENDETTGDKAAGTKPHETDDANDELLQEGKRRLEETLEGDLNETLGE